MAQNMDFMQDMDANAVRTCHYPNDERFPDLCRSIIWQFTDCYVTEEGEWFRSRARCHNNKGVLDEYRRPKAAYDVVKEEFENWAEWDHSIPYGLPHSTYPSETVKRFLAAVQVVVQ